MIYLLYLAVNFVVSVGCWVAAINDPAAPLSIVVLATAWLTLNFLTIARGAAIWSRLS